MAEMVSVLLTSFRRPKLLQGAIESVLAQTWRNTQLIVVDDNSGMDEVAVILNRHAGSITPVVTDVREDERLNKCRYAVCINLGLTVATGDFITYLTDDDVYYPTRLEKMVGWFRQHAAPQHMVVYCAQSQVNMDETGKVHLWGTHPTVGITRRPHGHVDHCSFMHRRECLEKIPQPYWPEDAGHWGAGDAAFFDRLVQHWHFYPIHEILDEHRHHYNSIQARMRRNLSPVYEQEF